MAELKTDRKTESVNALKNANKHLADLFSDMDKKNNTMRSVVSQLEQAARQCGDLRIVTYKGSNPEYVTLKTYLSTCVDDLNGARS